MTMGIGDSTGKSKICQTSRLDRESNGEPFSCCYSDSLPKDVYFSLVPDDCDGNGNSSGSGSAVGGGTGPDVLVSTSHDKSSSHTVPRNMDSVMDMSLADSMVSYMSDLSRTRRRRRRERSTIENDIEAEQQRMQLERALKNLEEMQRENKERMRLSESCSVLQSPNGRVDDRFSRTMSASAPVSAAPSRRPLLVRAHTLLALPAQLAARSPPAQPVPSEHSPPKSALSSEVFATPRGVRAASRRSASPPVIILTVDSRRNMGEADARRLLSVEGGRAASHAKMQQAAARAAGLSPVMNPATPPPPPPKSTAASEKRAKQTVNPSPKEGQTRTKELLKQKDPPTPKECVKPKETRVSGELIEPKESRLSKGSRDLDGSRELNEVKKAKKGKDVQELKDFKLGSKLLGNERKGSQTRSGDVHVSPAAVPTPTRGRTFDCAKPPPPPPLASTTAAAFHPWGATRCRAAPKENRSVAERAPVLRPSVTGRVVVQADEHPRRDAAKTGSTARRRTSLVVATQPERRAATANVRIAKLSFCTETTRHVGSPPPRSNKQTAFGRRKSLSALSHAMASEQETFRGLATERSILPRGKDSDVLGPPSRNHKTRAYGSEKLPDKPLVPYCIECGKKHIDDKGKFCAYCGHKREVCR